MFGREKIYHNTSTGKTGFGGITVSPLVNGALELRALARPPAPGVGSSGLNALPNFGLTPQQGKIIHGDGKQLDARNRRVEGLAVTRGHSDDEKPHGDHDSVAPKDLRQSFRSNVSPIREGGCTVRFRVSDTRCGTYVICSAYLQSEGKFKPSHCFGCAYEF